MTVFSLDAIVFQIEKPEKAKLVLGEGVVRHFWPSIEQELFEESLSNKLWEYLENVHLEYSRTLVEFKLLMLGKNLEFG